MASFSPDSVAAGPGSHPVREPSKLVVEHPIPVHDPAWLRRLHDRCLWDGGSRKGKSEFCCSRCEEQHAVWESRTAHVVLGREPLQTFLEVGT